MGVCRKCTYATGYITPYHGLLAVLRHRRWAHSAVQGERIRWMRSSQQITIVRSKVWRAATSARLQMAGWRTANTTVAASRRERQCCHSFAVGGFDFKDVAIVDVYALSLVFARRRKIAQGNKYLFATRMAHDKVPCRTVIKRNT